MRDVMLIYPVSGDGACLYNVISAFLYEDETQSANLRRMAHQYIVMNWWYWKQYIPLPFTETVGVGKDSFKVHFDKEDEYLEFLQSDKSLLMWSGHTDIAVLANKCNLNIYTFTFNVANQPPTWSMTPPDPYLTYYTNIDCSPVRDVAVYNANNCHYDLLVTPDSRLALLGSVPSRLNNNVHCTEENENDVLDDVIDIVASPSLKRPQSHLQDVPAASPLNFIPCPKGPGRPKNSRQGAASTKRKNLESETANEEPPKKRRGRPPGSKNKKKSDEEVIPTSRRLAEDSANPNSSTLPFFDSGDVCNICEFGLTDPIKREKKIIKCPRCSNYVHEPCLIKSGCSCTF